MTDLLDVNVWVALVDQRHVHHSLAIQYWSQDGAKQMAFCRVTMLGLLRLVTSSKAVHLPKTHTEAWAIYQEFMALPQIEFLEEPAAIDEHFEAFTTATAFPHRLWTDAYLAALAMASGCRLVSFDDDFKRFVGLNFLHLCETT